MKRHSTDTDAGFPVSGAIKSRPSPLIVRRKPAPRPRSIETRLLAYLKTLNR